MCIVCWPLITACKLLILLSKCLFEGPSYLVSSQVRVIIDRSGLIGHVASPSVGSQGTTQLQRDIDRQKDRGVQGEMRMKA